MVTFNKAIKAVSGIIIISIIGKVFGLVRDVYLAKFFGAGAEMDAYNVAFNLPAIILAGLLNATSTSFIPVYTDQKKREGRQKALQASSSILTFFSLTAIAFCLFGIAAAPWIVPVLVPKFSPEKASLVITLARILFLTSWFRISISLASNLLQAEGRFLRPAIAALPISLITILTVIFLAPRTGIYALVIGVTISTIVQFALLVPGLRQIGLSLYPRLVFSSPGVKRLLYLSLPVFATTMAFQIKPVIGQAFASGLPTGSISALAYANRLISPITTMIVPAVAIVCLPALSQAAADQDMPQLNRILELSIQGAYSLILPIMVGMAILSRPLIRLIFERGAFDIHATMITVTALLSIAPGIAVYGLQDILTRIFHAFQDTLTPMFINIAGVIVNIGLFFFLVPPYGLVGLALSTSIASVLSCLLTLIILHTHKRTVSLGPILRSLGRLSLATGIMGVLTWRIYVLCIMMVPVMGKMSLFITILVPTILGGLAYLVLLRFFCVPEFTSLSQIIKTKYGADS